MKRTIALLLSIALLFSMGPFSLAEPVARPGSYVLGAKINDFTFTTYNGEVMTLSDILREKDMVLINIWASWCGPCRMEFPYLQEAYAQYQDQVEVIALSCEPTDTDQNLAQFAAQYGLTFKVGRDPVNFLSALNINSIPVSLVVDRFGVICFIKAGAQTSAEPFTRLFDAFVGDDYTESILLTDIPAKRPAIAAASDAEISAAVEVEAKNISSANVMPMKTEIEDGRNVVVSSNNGYASSISAISTSVSAKAGEAIVVMFKTSTEPVFDGLRISVNDEVIKFFTGQHEWMTYAIPVDETGTYEVMLSYHKDHITDGGEDTVWVDYITVVDDADAIAANPLYPMDDSLLFDVISPGAKQVTIEDPTGILYNTFGNAKYYVVNSDTVEVAASLTADMDPERAFMVSYYDGSYISMAQAYTQDGFRMRTGVDSILTTGYHCSYVMLYEDVTGKDPIIIVNFRDEDNLNDFIRRNGLGAWQYIDVVASEDDISSSLPAESTYEIHCVDQDGNPVQGVLLQICDDTTCQVVTTDANGSYTLKAKPYAWEVHILKAPEGYTADSKNVSIMPAAGGTATFSLEKQ